MTLVGLVPLGLVAVMLLLLAIWLVTGRSGARDDRDTAGLEATDARPAAPADGTATPVPGSLPARDLAEALRLTGGSRDIADSLLRQMLVDLPAQTDALARAAAAGEWVAAGHIARGMRGGSAVCAVPALHAAICALGDATGQRDTAAVAAALAAIDREERRLGTPYRIEAPVTAAITEPQAG